ncbi:TraB/GumN family protein [Solilutibacter silvestris]|uniref:TraB: TraB family protein n=1 Tax=Solilutibacter silvestris TaxID=1645665 RepID=A0A2K1PYJ8_9GAMM|nr:TraB/GumN family protein [Lysobacter silvestris]PNS07860.1 traB: TraB family protein [Lysobacter silvestris]
MTDHTSPGIDWRDQPHAEIERDGVHYTLLGTAHVSRTSVDAVRAAVDSGEFDAVAVELDEQRYKAMNDPDALAKLDLVKVIKDRKLAMFAANLGLAAYQRRLAEQLGIEPGAELKAAANEATARGLAMNLIDRDVGQTFRRAMHKLGFWQRMKIGSGIAVSLFVDEEVSPDQIEGLKEGDMLESSFGEFASGSPALYSALIDERDQYMAARLRETAVASKRVLAVVGAGHLKGIANYLANDARDPAALIEELSASNKKKRIPWFSIALTLLILGGFTWGFMHGGAAFGRQLVIQWIAWTAGLTALGGIIALAHPLATLAATIMAPLKPFRPPGLSSGVFAALVQVRLVRPTYSDFMALRDDAQSLRGWYRNRVCRVILVFMLTNFGTIAGEWIAIANGARHLVG